MVGFVSWKFSVRSDWMLSFKYGRWQIPKTFGMTHGRCRDKSPCHLCMCGDLVGCKSEKHVFQMNLMLTGFSILVRFGCCETEKRHPESKMYLLKQQLKLLPQWWGFMQVWLLSFSRIYFPPPKSHFFKNLVQFLAALGGANKVKSSNHLPSTFPAPPWAPICQAWNWRRTWPRWQLCCDVPLDLAVPIQVREEQVPTAVPGQTFRDPNKRILEQKSWPQFLGIYEFSIPQKKGFSEMGL